MDIEQYGPRGAAIRWGLIEHGMAEFSICPLQDEVIITANNHRVILNDTEIARLSAFIVDRAKQAKAKNVPTSKRTR